MRLDQALVQRGLCESRTEAGELVTLGRVLVDGIVTTKKTRNIEEDRVLEVTARRKFVSRGGEKLEGALTHVYGENILVGKHIFGTTAIDVGSSTGGFTDCLLSYGVASVTAVDVGTMQLHSKLRRETRVTLFENTDIRNFTSENTFDIVVADLSFIPLEKVIDTIFSFGHSGSEYFLLIKPQFEVGKGNTKKGIVKDKSLLTSVLERYSTLATERRLRDIQVFPCVIAGGDGNQEYFLYGKLT